MLTWQALTGSPFQPWIIILIYFLRLKNHTPVDLRDCWMVRTVGHGYYHLLVPAQAFGSQRNQIKQYCPFVYKLRMQKTLSQGENVIPESLWGSSLGVI